jgi:MFS family permease
MLTPISRKQAWSMWFFASLFYAYQYILRVLPNILMPEIMSEFHIDAAIFGQFSGLYYIGYVGAHIPLGIFLDRKGPKFVIPICIILTVLGLLSLVFASQWIYPSLGRVLTGIGSSAAILGAFKVIRIGFKEEQFTRMLCICVTIGLIGAIYGGQPVHYLLKVLGWREVLIAISLFGVGLAAIIFLLTPSIEQAPTQKTSILNDIESIFKNYKVVAICLLAGMMVGPLEGFADVWGTGFLRAVYALNDQLATSLPSFIFLGMCFGAPLLSCIAEKTQGYFATIILSAVVMGAGFVFILLKIGDVKFLSITFVVIGVMCSYQILAIYKASTYVQEKLTGLTTAVANMIIMAFGYVFHSSIGFLMNMYWDGRIAHDTPVYNSHAFTMALTVIPVALFIAAIGFSVIVFNEQGEKKDVYA